MGWLARRRRGGQLKAALVTRARKQDSRTTSKAYDRAWDLYDQMPSGWEKRRMAFRLCFSRHDAAVYEQESEIMRDLLAEAT